MKHRNLKAEKILKALVKYDCKTVRNTPHGVILENPENNQSINIPLHRDELAIWIYNNILRRLSIDKKKFEENYLN
ncbi:MAG: hypothetical protein KJ905_01880 [Nanoarchaeota archaeon]|nr:hypothetical protein [Nanoarchaeota archaeon]